MKWIARIWLIITMIILMWIYFIFISPKIFNNKTIIIPDIINMAENEALSKLEEMGVNYKLSYVENDENIVLKTIPYAGVKIKSKNYLTVYVGQKAISSYNSFLGLRYDDYQLDIERFCQENNLELIISYEESSEISGLIIKESIVDGSNLANYDKLELTIAVNDDSFLMPNLVGLSIEEALKIINEYKLKVNINYIQSLIDRDIVIFQSATANTLISKNNNFKIELYISKGIDDYANLDIYEIIETMNSLGYFYEIKYLNSNETANKLVAFEVEKYYDMNVVKYTIYISPNRRIYARKNN